MTLKQIQQILKDTDFVHTGGTADELKVAEYLKSQCEAMGVPTHIESFPVQMAVMQEARLFADGAEIPAKGYFCCGSGDVEAPFYYMPNSDPVSIAGAKGKIVLLDTGIPYFTYHDLLDSGAVGIVTYDGNVNFRDNDIDQKELRGYVSLGQKIPCANINAKDAVKLVRNKTKTVRIVIREDEYEGESRNVVAEIPGSADEWISFTAHYDTTSLSHGAYDNMTGCLGLLGIMENLAKTAPNRYGLRFIFCGSEERGLLGSKAYAAAHEEELKNCVLNINLDMIGSVMGKFIACVTAEDKLVDYVAYLGAEVGWPINARQGVYSSDSTPFADKGVPAVSFARIAGGSTASIHNRYDTMALLSAEQIRRDTDFIALFAGRMANAAKCPVSKEIPEKVRTELDEYLNRKLKS